VALGPADRGPPATTDIYEVYGLLNEGMAEGTWWFDEMHVGHALREKG
jgi:hypothetical protein